MQTLVFLVHLENGGSHPCKPKLSDVVAEWEQVTSSALLPPITNYTAVWKDSASLALPPPTHVARLAICDNAIDQSQNHGQVACQPPLHDSEDPHAAANVAVEMLPSSSRFGENVVTTRKHVHNRSPFILCLDIQCVRGLQCPRAHTCLDSVLVAGGQGVWFRADVFAHVRRRIASMIVCASWNEPDAYMYICIAIVLRTWMMTRGSACATLIVDTHMLIPVHARVYGRRNCQVYMQITTLALCKIF